MLRLGRHIERGDMVTRVLDVRAGLLLGERPEHAELYDDLQWSSVLRSLSALQMYNRRSATGDGATEVIRFILGETSFPRSVAYCLAGVQSAAGAAAQRIGARRVQGGDRRAVVVRSHRAARCRRVAPQGRSTADRHRHDQRPHRRRLLRSHGLAELNQMDAKLPPSYVPTAGRYDELVDVDGSLRPHWESMVRTWTTLGAPEIVRRQMVAERLLVAEGAGHVFHDDREIGVPWGLDPVPYVIDAAQWRGIERGLSQRTRVLDAVLEDLYGPRRLLIDNVIPTAAVMGSRAYQLAAVGVGCAAAAADVVRRRPRPRQRRALAGAA